MCRARTRAVLAVLVAVAVLPREAGAQARPPRCSPAAADAALPRGDCTSEYNSTKNGLPQYDFTVQGKYFGVEYEDGRYVGLRCEGGGAPTLLSESLPAFETELRVEHVHVEGCAVAEYARVFRALNVTLAERFNLTLADTGSGGGGGGGGGGGAPLAASHLAGLPGAGVRSLTLRGAGSPRGPLLASLPNLAALSLTSTRLPPGELDAPPPLPLLEHVTLADAGVTRVPAALLALPRLHWLTVTVTGEGVVSFERTPATPLRHLTVSEAEEALLTTWTPPSLETGYVSGWRSVSPVPVPSCSRLTSLTLVSPATRRLPPGWVSRCQHLALLEVRFARLEPLPARLLTSASSLTRLVLRSVSLVHLPADLFEETPRLAYLDLTGNHLKELPSGLLKPVSETLLSLNLSENEVTAEVGRALGSLHHLRQLSLANNPSLGDLCATDKLGYVTVSKFTSPLVSLSELEVLNLRNTNVRSVCSDWRTRLLLLAELDLRGTRITSLTYEDFVYERKVRSVVRLQGIPLAEVLFTEEEYTAAERAHSQRPHGDVTLHLGGSLVCDCYLYWFARALDRGLLPLADRGLRCRAGGALADTRPEDMLCPAGPAACPAPLPRGCTCGVGDGGAVLRVRCEGAALTRVPRLPTDGPPLAVDLLLANNTITELTADDIPPTLRSLDLSNNSIRVIEEVTAVELVGRVEGGSRRVQLAGNPLECTCRLAGARRVLRAGRRHLAGYEEALRCVEDGKPLAAVSDEGCPRGPSGALGGALAGLAGAALVVLAAVAGRRRALPRLKAVLRALGWAPPSPPEEEALPYDVFVTFGRGDEGAALEVAARLEGGARPRRVLLQERDWLPPAWLPHCVQLSVGLARRTVALLSPPWERSLESGEVRAAFEPAWRGVLLLVLPPAAPAPAAAAPTDAALRRYARDFPHLVLRRGEPGFWRELERALPPPPPPPPPPLDIKV